MKKSGTLIFHICNLAVIVTGCVYGLMRYCMQSTDEFAVVNHPWQPHALHLHILAAPLLVAMVGYFAGHHALPYWRNKVRKGRWSGLTMVLMAAPMVFSGYLIQTVVMPEWRRIWFWAHMATSLLWIAFVLGHVLIHVRPRRKAMRGAGI